MSKFVIQGGNQGAVGDKSRASNFSQQDNRKLELNAEDLATLVQELPRLSAELTREAKTQEQSEVADHVQSAEQSARNGDSQTTLARLKSAGLWALEVARNIGTDVTARIIAHQLGIG